MIEIKDKIMEDKMYTKTLIKAKIKDKTLTIINIEITETQGVALRTSTKIKVMLNLEEGTTITQIKNIEW